MLFESNGYSIGRTSSSLSARDEAVGWFETEVAPLRPSMTRYLRNRFPRLGDPEDIVQEACLRILGMHRSGQRIRSARSVLMRILRNLAVDHIRRRMRTPILDITYEHACRIPADAPSVGDSACRRQELEILHEAIQQLPPRCRQVIHLRLDHGLRNREIARLLNISEGTVENQITRGFAQCREYLRERSGPERREVAMVGAASRRDLGRSIAA